MTSSQPQPHQPPLPQAVLALVAADQPARIGTGYPAPFRAACEQRRKQPLGDAFGLKNFGVNRTTLPPGSASALLHRHSHADEFIYILAGEATLITDAGETPMTPGMCAGFPAQGIAHCLVNRSAADVVYLEIGDRRPDDEGLYPNDDLWATPGPDGRYRFLHKDGSSY